MTFVFKGCTVIVTIKRATNVRLAYLGGSRERASPALGVKLGVSGMLFGEYYQQIDEKGRVRIPARLKPQLLEPVMITKGTNGCLFLFSANEWNENLAKKLSTVPFSDIPVQRAVRTFFSSADQLETDNQGRSLLPRNLREFAGIKKDIVFIGVGNRAEVWSREVYDAYMKGETAKNVEKDALSYDKTVAELNKYGI